MKTRTTNPIRRLSLVFPFAVAFAVFALPLSANDAPSEHDAATDAAVPSTDTAPSAEPAVDADEIDLYQVFEQLGVDAAQWYQHVQTLANPFFEGRVSGSKGVERARNYLEFYFKKYDLKPAFPDAETKPEANGTPNWTRYRQAFTFQTRGRMDISVDDAHASISGNTLTVNEDYVLLGNSASEAVEGPVTFVGYGIADGPRGYSSFDDNTHLDGRIALLLRYEPLNENGESQWASERFSQHAAVARKMRTLVERGASGIILVNPPNVRDGRRGLIPLAYSARFGRPLDIPVMQVTQDVAERMLSHSATDVNADSLMDWRRLADRGEITTVDLSNDLIVQFGGTLKRERNRDTLTAANVGAVLRGQGDLASEWLVIGGHYDHNGYGNMLFSADPDAGPLYPGADDNASGVAGIIILAKRLSQMYANAEPDQPLRSVLFIAFDAEERGLHGSRHFAEHPTIEPSRIIAMLNMDMIGRMRNDHLTIFGVGTGEGLETIVQRHLDETDLASTISKTGTGRSDDANFHRIKVPAMHFFTGMHEQYTTPEDKAWTVNPAGAIEVLDLMEQIAIDLVTEPERLAYTEPPESPGRDRGYAPVRLGIRPGMGEDLETGVLLDDVSAGTSADDAGLQGGDILLKWDDTELDSLRTLVGLLREHEPGDVVTVTYRRDGKEQTVDVTLKASEDSER